ncbi:ShlB/FhaC/HecB family hemolysin secretion/activation protein [Fodinicurvata sp. EGI_FJ10296]|uniref:ShlB/FhaC/HecB family hemolysin secretion/activation protein n=1 Tax=Fodinicurvata sp. EGI_FJ10296 TaxID=3231908 RepID=UPI003454E248
MARLAAVAAIGLGCTMMMPLYGPASAQDPQIPPSVDPGTIDVPMPAPAVDEPSIPATDPRDPAAPEGAEDVVFVLGGIELQGNNAIDDDALAPIFSGQVGSEVSLADVYGFAHQVTLAYRDAGYILAQAIVPAQEIEDGVVTLRVVEGYVDQVAVTDPEGEPTAGHARIEQYGASISASRPLRQRDLERYLLLANDLPGVSVRSVLSASPVEPGAADLTLVVDEQRVEGFVAADNRGTRYIGPVRTTIGATLNNPTGNNETVSIVAATTPEDTSELRYISGSAEVPIGYDGLVLHGSVSHSQTQPGSSLRQFGIDGRTTSWTIGADYPLIRSRDTNLTIGARFDYTDAENAFDPQFRLLDYEDRLRVVRVGIDGDVLDSYRGITSFGAEVSQGVDIFDATISDTGVSRTGGRGDFTKLTLDASRLQSLGSGFSLYGAVRAQIASDVLLASEEFAVGGARFGRAYDGSEVTGDGGIAGSLEARYAADVSSIDQLDSLQFYAFYDIGMAEKRGAESESAASAGGGIRFGLFDTLSGSLEVAQPLTRDVAAEGNRDTRFFFSLAATF